MPASYNMPIWRGNNSPVAWRFKNADGSLFDLTGSRLILTIFWRGQRKITKDSSVDAAFVVDLVTSIATWTPTVAETRSIPLGSLAEYELERWIGAEQKTLVAGNVMAQGGKNIDV